MIAKRSNIYLGGITHSLYGYVDHHKCLGGSTCEGFVCDWVLCLDTCDIDYGTNKFTFWSVVNLLKCINC